MPKIRSCLQCRQSYPSNSAKQKYCSKACQYRARRKGISVTCVNCGKSFLVPPSRFKQSKTGRFRCSITCTAPRSEQVCAQCGRLVQVTAAQLKASRSGRVYCSHACYSDSMRTPVTRAELDHWYNTLGETTAQIGVRLGIHGRTVIDLMEGVGLSRRDKVDAAIRYPRQSFSGDQLEMAYLMGFRTGDLNVRKDLPTSRTIHVRSGTTVQAQADLIRSLFEPYGHVHTRIGTIGEIQIECHLDLSFDFLMEKDERLPDWVMADDDCFWAYAAGYSDAEAYIGLTKTRSGKVARFELGACDQGIIEDLWQGFSERLVICPAPKKKNPARRKDGDLALSNCDFYRFHVIRKTSLDRLFAGLYRYSKHANKRIAIEQAWQNVQRRGI